MRAISKLEIAKALHEKGFTKEQIDNLLKLVDWIMRLPDNLERWFYNEYAAFVEEKKMPFVSIFEKRAIAKDRPLTRAQTLRENIMDNLAYRFDSKPARIKKKLQLITSTAKLKSLHRFAIAAKTLAEFEARLP